MPVELVNVMTSYRLERRFLTLLKWQNNKLLDLGWMEAQPCDFKEKRIVGAVIQHVE